MAQQDETVTKLADDAEAKRKQDEVVRPAQDMPLVAKLLIVWVGAYVLFFTQIFPWSQLVRFIIFMALMFLVFFVSSQSFSSGELPEEQIAAIAYKRLVFFQQHKFGDGARLPPGRIRLNPVGVPQFESWDSDKIKWWNHSFTIQSQVGSEVFKGIIRTHAVTGLSRGILRTDGEFTGIEEPNIKFVGKEDLAKTKWARDQLSKFPPLDGF